MISEIQIGNFKAFGPAQTIPLRPITLVFGQNSAGKSSIIQGLLLARHIQDTDKADAHQTTLGGSAVDLGGFERYVHKPFQVGHSTTLSFGFNRPVTNGKGRFLDPFKTVNIDYTIGRTMEGGVSIISVSLSLDGASVWRLDRHDDGVFRMNDAVTSVSSLVERLTCESVAWKDLLATLEPDHPLAEEIADRAKCARIPRTQLFETGTSRLRVDKCRELWDILSLRPKPTTLFKELARAGFRACELELRATSPMQVPKKSRYGCEKEEEEEREYRLLLRYAAQLRDHPEEFQQVLDLTRDQNVSGVRSFISFSSDGDDIVWDDFRWDCEPLERAKAVAVRHIFERYIETANEAIREMMQSLSYLGPLRWIPPRLIPEGDQFDASWKAGGGEAWQRLRREPELLDRVNRFLQDTLHSQYRLRRRQLTPQPDAEAIQLCVKRAMERSAAASSGNPASDSDTARVAEDAPPSVREKTDASDLAAALESELRAQTSGDGLTELSLVDDETGLTVSHRDVGTGISQLLPVLVNAAGGKKQLIAIEQPELHLHPALQAELGDVFIESALGGNENKFLIETHSEQLILRIMRRIRESNAGKQPNNLPAVKPDDVAILFVQPTESGAVVKHLRVDERGRLLDEWPGGFFEESFDEIF